MFTFYKFKTETKCLHQGGMLTLTLMAFLASVLGCGGKIPAPKGLISEPGPYHEALDRREAQLRSLSGELSVELWEQSKRIGVRQLFASQAPSKLRIDTLTPFEQPLATVIFNTDLLSVHDREAGRFMIGEANPQHFERLTKLRLHPREMTALLNGHTPRISHSGGSLTWDEKRGRALLTLTQGARQQLITFDEKDFTPRMIELYENDNLLVRILLAEYTAKEPKLPLKLRIELPRQEITVNTKLLDHTINPELPEAAFSVEAPKGLNPVSF